MSGFVMSILGSTLGIVRLLGKIGIFELLKPELRKFHPRVLNSVKRSFCRPKHWLTMLREMLNLKTSGYQLQCANDFGTLPIALITASSFFKPSFLMTCLPVKSANQLREKMHSKMLQLSKDCISIQARHSGHFVWIDQPEVILEAIEIILGKIDY